MKFQQVEGQFLEIEYLGEPLDLYSFGIFHLNMQEVVDKVALGLLSQAGLLEPTWKRAKYLPRRPYYPSERIIRAEIHQLETGSFFEGIKFAVATALADPNVIALLQNLGANVIWAVGESGIRGIKERIRFQPNNFRWFNRNDDPIEIGANLREVLVAIAQNNDGKSARIKFKSRTSKGDKVEVVIEIDGEND